MGIYFDEESKLFFIETKSTTMCLAITDTEGFLNNVYYGAKIQRDNLRYLLRTGVGPFVPSVNERDRGSYLDCARMEFPSSGVGDYRPSSVTIADSAGHDVSQFLYESHRIFRGKENLYAMLSEGRDVRMPATFEGKGKAETLEITLSDDVLGIKALLSYSVFEDCDVIVRSAKFINSSDDKVKLTRMLSMLMDYDKPGMKITSFHGSWTREMNKSQLVLPAGKYVNSSFTGTSSNRCNPFFMISDADATETDGDVWGFPAIATEDTYIKKGSRIAQFKLMSKGEDVTFEQVESLGNIDRGGFGSTGEN